MRYALLLVLLIAAPASAQNARVRVRAGDVTGMEMNLEGGLIAPRGGTLRWIVTAYEVTGLSDLRPAVDATVHLTTSLQQTEDAAQLRTDAHGRVLLELPVPADTDEDSFRAVLRIVSSGGVQRRFELTVRVTPGDGIEVHVARPNVEPRGSMRAFGRVFEQRSGRPRANAEVRLTLRDDHARPVLAPVELRTDSAGLFAHTFRVPRDVRGSVSVEARTGDDEHPVVSSAASMVSEPRAEPMLVAVAPERRIVRPGERIRLDVVVRTPNGRPIEGATVTLDGAEARDPDRRARTDGRGRATLAWTVPVIASGVSDFLPGVTASREGYGSARGVAQVRAVADEHAGALSIEGGALSPELGGRVYVRVVQPDGRPAQAGIPVRIEGPRLPAGGVSATTDDDGVATLDVVPARAADATTDRCGGQSATAIDVRIGPGPRFAVLSPCMPLDPDAAARVRVARPLSVAGAPIEITVDRIAAAARAPVELTIMTGSGEAIAASILAAGEQRTSITLPPEAGGFLWVRARPLIGNTREVVRGGTAAFWVSPGAPLRVLADLERDGTVRARFEGPSDDAPHAYVVAAPIDEAVQLTRELRARTLGPFGELRRDPAGAHDALLFGALAATTPPDVGAPSVLRAGRVVPVPAPADPASVGLLRDPWRARSRFVTGRLALIFHALEQYVGNAIPERIDDVAVRGARGFTFNGQILESVAASGSLGPAGATGLGGEPLTIEQLQRFDPSLTYDNVARRITRERLFRLILALRNFVQGRGFDLPWSRLGDPSTWIRQLENQYVQGVGTIERRMLADGWGRPFRLMPARGGRSRFTFVDPLGAWELVSSGADGRFGTGDDMWDPTVRILRSGSPYAEAVGEDVLVARLEGVELGRASLELLPTAEPSAAQIGGVPYEAGAPARQLAQQMWTAGLPSVLEPDPDPLGLRRPAFIGDGAGGVLSVLPREGGTVPLTLDDEPRTWGAVVYAWTESGWGTVDMASSLGGSPVLVEGEVPARLHTGEAVTLDLALTNLNEQATSLRLEAQGDGIEVQAPSQLDIAAGEAADVALELTPSRTPGPGTVTLTLRTVDGAAVRTMRWTTRRDTGMHPLRLRAAGLVRRRPLVTSLPIPQDAERIAGRVVVVAPSALASDPDLADLRRNDPALVAWSNALAGRESDAELWSRLLLAQDPDGTVRGDLMPLSSACAAVAWATADEQDTDARRALDRLREAIAQLGNIGVPRDPDPELIRGGAAMLAALAGGGAPSSMTAEQRELDPLIPIVAAMRIALRRTLRSHPGEPTLLARASAALLLADPRDAYGIAMLDRASEQLVDAPDGGAMVRGSVELDDPIEALSATLALGLAAHQAGRDDLAERLLRGGLGRDHVALRRGGEAAFWMLAAAAYGALGQDPESVAVFVDGRRSDVALEGGRGVLELTPRAGNQPEVRVEAPEGRGAFARIEAALERPFVARDDGPMRLELRGDAGDSGGVAALELTVHAEREVASAIVDIEIPAGVELDETTLDAIRSAAGVGRVERREPGFLRVSLGDTRAATNVVIPLPLRWGVRGSLRGLGAIAYPLGHPEQMTVLAPRVLTVAPPADE
jgi:hypothetical protein